MGGLYLITFWTSFLGLILALWLGIYLVTHNPKYPIAWLTAATLWSMAGLFLNILIAMDPPDVAYWPAWLHSFFPFWKNRIYTGDATSWLQGWSIVPACAIWHHATTLLRPGRVTKWRNVRILGGYGIAAIAILVQAISPILFTIENSDPLFLKSLNAGPWFPIFGIAILILTLASVTNLVRTTAVIQEPLPRKQISLLLWTTPIFGLVGPLSLVGSTFHWPIPIVGLSLAVGIPIGLLGYGVARYSALMEGRTIRRNFFYNFALLTSVVLVYLLASHILIQIYHVPEIILVIVPMLSVITHSLMNPAYRLLDWLFFRSSALHMRATLRQLLRLAIEGKTMEDNLADALRDVCRSVAATFGIIVTLDERSVNKVASFHSRANLANLAVSDFIADDVVFLQLGQFKRPLRNAVLLIPLYADVNQLGALVLGCPVNGVQYAHEEVERLMNLTDQFSDVIYIARQKSEYMRQIVELSNVKRKSNEEPSITITILEVESSLRNLNDYAFLADSPLSAMSLVASRLTPGESTHLDRGKILHLILIEAIEKLRPQSTISRDPPPREWHPYLILWEAYREEKANRDIMSYLYISEGMFNRTRRSAIRSIARTLGEMELAHS